MTNEVYTPWRVIGESVRGAAHERKGMPNQDACAWLPERGEGSVLCVAVADGHGNARYFRSDVGARLAAEVATEGLEGFLADCGAETNLSLIKRIAEERLPRYLVRAWLKAVEADYANKCLTNEEKMRLMSAGIPQKPIEANPAIAYGTTLLAVAVAPTFLLFLQLGDGDILSVTEAGEVSRPLPQDKRLIANETTSLCTPHAWREMRVRFQALAGVPPALILLATDGYANSFRDEAGFLQVGSDLLAMIREVGIKEVQANLATWLADASQEGSGDDITLALVCQKSEIVPQISDVMPSEQTAKATASEQTVDVTPNRKLLAEPSTHLVHGNEFYKLCNL